MFSIDIILITGKLYKTIIVDNLELTYLQIKELFDNIDSRFYQIINNNNVIYTNLYDLNYDKIILNNYLTIVFINSNNYICYKELTEYGLSIIINKITGDKVYNIFLDDNRITTLYNIKTNTGLYEKIYSNRTEYYINGIYYSSELDNKIENIILNNTKLILKDKKYPVLYEFIKSDNNITLISYEEFNL